MEFIPEVSPRLMAPRHLAALVEAIERSETEPVRAIVSVPPRHAKTETLLHGIARGLKKRPARVFGYAGYSDQFAHSKSRRARLLAKLSGVRLGEARSLGEWRTDEGGGLLAAGVGGSWTGHGVDCLFVDDPLKDRVQAESAVTREKQWEWWEDVASTRLEPGSSAFVVMTRWHVDDLAGRLIKAEGTVDKGGRWQLIRLPALSEDGEERALWPERWPKHEMLKKRGERGPYSWASLFQGRPVPRGGKVFGDPRTYRELPKYGLRFSIGLDLSYAAKTSNDWSVAVLFAEERVGEGESAYSRVYVIDVVRKQVTAPDFKFLVRGLRIARAPTARLRWYASGTELGAADFFKAKPDPLHIQVINAGADKLIRATSYAAAWNAGRVLLPEEAPWLDDFIEEHINFTGAGTGKETDDQVDAGAAGYDLAVQSGSGDPFAGYGPSAPRRQGV